MKEAEVFESIKYHKLNVCKEFYGLTDKAFAHIYNGYGPDGVITIRELTRWSFMAGAAFETVDVPGIGKLQGYQNDGGKGSLSEVGGIVGQATEGAVRGALKSQGK